MSKEIELTAALEKVRAKEGMMGVVLNGKMFDMGKPDAFRNAVQNYGMKKSDIQTLS